VSSSLAEPDATSLTARLTLPTAQPAFTASLGISAGILAAMFTFTYLPQAAVLAVFQLGPLGFVTAVGVVLTESAFVIRLSLPLSFHVFRH
jgi:hypothetical protein